MLVVFFIGVILLTALDQFSKWIVLQKLTEYESVPLLRGVFHFTYCENRGAAFGILQNQVWIFALITVAVLVAVIYYMLRVRPKSKWLNVSFMLLVSGALGNFIDRIFRGFVVDFFDFCLIHFPIFNVADCFVVIGAVMLAVYLIFSEYRKENQ